MKLTDGRARVAATDLSNVLACRHLPHLEALEARGELVAPWAFDAGFQQLIERGEAHERRILGLYRQTASEVVEVPRGRGTDDTERAAATSAAMRSGVDVIYQGVLLADDDGVELLGRPDFLVRAGFLAGGRSLSEQPDYEVVDAKLARSARARAILQCAFYSHLVGRTTGRMPRRLHLALGDGRTESMPVSEFAAYERRLRRQLRSFALEALEGVPEAPYPEPVEHCAVCRWRSVCRNKRRADDDLSLVAGMPASQRLALKEVGIGRRTQFAELDQLPTLDRVREAPLDRSRLQARLQVASEQAGQIRYQLLEPDRDADGDLVGNWGLLALPEPCEGDLFFDIEGARYYSEDEKEFGLQYLFGIIDTADLDERGQPRYTEIWAFDRKDEKRAFEELIDFISERRARHPGLHVYHYNHYEPTSVDHLTELHSTREEAVGRLMGRFATREDEVDGLFRGGVFVDLYRLVRQSLRAGVESYSIKRLEPLVGFARQVDLEDATEHLVAFETALDAGEAADDTATRSVVAGYNEDDCRATLALRDWLEQRRPELEAQIGQSLPRPSAQQPESDRTDPDPDLARLKEELRAGLPENPEQYWPADRAKSLLADLLEWHRREAKPAWWRFFHLQNLSNAELVHEPDAIGELTGGDICDRPRRSVVRRFRFPPQEHGFGPGDTVLDPVSNKQWTVVGVDEDHGTIELRIGKDETPVPSAVIGTGPIPMNQQSARLRELGERVAAAGVHASGAAGALLLRSSPDGLSDGAALRRAGEEPAAAVRRLARDADRSCLPVQGPPGAGKTYVGAETIVDLVELGRIVGVTAPSHAVICNLLDNVAERAAERRITVRIGQRPDPGGRFLHHGARSLESKDVAPAFAAGELDVVGGTSWLWSRDDLSGSVDTIFVDEAGQLSLADTLAVADAAENLVLLGDPQQLTQPSQAAHPPGAGASALGHVLGELDTIPDRTGVFLDRTYRMHPDLCAYTSEMFYDGRLGGVPGLELQSISGRSWPWSGSGILFVGIDHSGNSNASSEEAAEVTGIIKALLAARWTDREGIVRPMDAADVLVVAPFNAQVRMIDRTLAQGGITGVQVGTVDKFQGRQAPAVVYSMASSSLEDAPRGLEFLLDLHRLNVATSRAQAVAVIVASPGLLDVICRTRRQMVQANALCRAAEFAPALGVRRGSPGVDHHTGSTESAR